MDASTFPPPPFRPEGAVFDLDGLLVDSEGAWSRAEKAVVTSFGAEWDPAIHSQLLGTSPEDSAALLGERLGAAPAEILRRLEEAALEEFRSGIDPRPGAVELLSALAGRIPLGVATNSPPTLAERSLRSAGLRDMVDVVVTPQDVAAPKPAPDPYLQACRALGIDPSRSVGFEDSSVGASAARAAGLWVVGCPSEPDEPMDVAHVVVPSLTVVDPAWFLGDGQEVSRSVAASA